jgi:hypothetical protein
VHPVDEIEDERDRDDEEDVVHEEFSAVSRQFSVPELKTEH